MQVVPWRSLTTYLPRVAKSGPGLSRPPRTGRGRARPRLCWVMLKPERGDIYDAMAILGLKKRTIEALAARVELPGAAKLANRWTFDLEMLRAYVRDEVKRQCAENIRRHRPAAFGAAIPSTVELGSRAGSSHGRFTQITRGLRQSGARRARTV